MAALRRAIAIVARLDHHRDLASDLIGLAAIGLDGGDLVAAARLAGAVEAVDGASGIPVTPAERAQLDFVLARLAEVLGPTAQRELDAGRALDVDAAVAFALDPTTLLLHQDRQER